MSDSRCPACGQAVCSLCGSPPPLEDGKCEDCRDLERRTTEGRRPGETSYEAARQRAVCGCTRFCVPGCGLLRPQYRHPQRWRLPRAEVLVRASAEELDAIEDALGRESLHRALLPAAEVP